METKLATGRWWGGNGDRLAAGLAEMSRELPNAPRRGLLLMGAVGTGKTTAIKGAWKPGVFFDLGSAGTPEMARLNDWRPEGGDLKGDVLLDRLGRESEAYLLDYNRRDVVGQFLLRLWDAWKSGAWRGRLFAATDFSEKELSERYGEDVAVRLGLKDWPGMCVPIRFEADATWEPASDAAARMGQLDDGSDYRERGFVDGEAGDRARAVNSSADCFRVAFRIAVVNLRALKPREAADVWVAMCFEKSPRGREVLRRRLEDVTIRFLEGDAEGASRAARAAWKYATCLFEAGHEALHGENAVKEGDSFTAAAETWKRPWKWEEWGR